MFTSVDTFSRTLAAAVSQQSQVKRAQSALLLGCQDLAKGFQLTFGARDFGMSISSICTRHVTFSPFTTLRARLCLWQLLEVPIISISSVKVREACLLPYLQPPFPP